jgi:phosphoribosylformylglycinamidine synthase
MLVAVTIRLKSGIPNAPQEGEDKKRALHAQGFTSVLAVQTAKRIVLDLKDDTPLEDVDQMCRQLLSNPVIEEYEAHEVTTLLAD